MPTPPDLCEAMRRRAAETCRLVGDGHRLGMTIGEETLTDLNLLELQAGNPGEVSTIKFTRLQEGQKTGADWEWWVRLASGSWLKLRVQAKRLNLRTSSYHHINYPKQTGRQLRDLVKDARASRAVPLYCFYNFWEPSKASPWRCKCHPEDQAFMGCTIAAADHIESLGPLGRKKRRHIERRWIPWHCLVCCVAHGGFDSEQVPPISALPTLDQLLGSDTVAQASNAVHEDDDLPQYVRELLHRGPLGQSLPSGGPLLDPPEGVSRVLVMNNG